MKKLRSNEHALGIMVTHRALHAVLLKGGDEGPQVVRTFSRQRTSRAAAAQPQMAGGPADMGLPDTTEASDFTIQFGGGGSSSSELFLASEFGGVDPAAGEDERAGSRTQASLFTLELGDILAECRDAGYENLSVAFCVGSAEVGHTELRVVDAKGKRKGDKGKKDGEAKESAAGKAPRQRVSRAELMAQLRDQHDGELSDECVSFLPMTALDDGRPRYLAVYPKPSEPVAATLTEMRAQKVRRMPAVRGLDAEASVYLGMARLMLKKTGVHLDGDTPPNTLVVRASTDDTLVLFLKGDVPQHFESLRSLTSYDSPETICSRVLLLQDEYGAGEVQHVLLLSEEREDGLIDSFEMFFPEARVESLWRYLPPTAAGPLPVNGARGLVAAVGAALRLFGDEEHSPAFAEVNLLPSKLMRKQFHLPVTWHVIALGILIFCTVFFFVGRYVSNEQEIEQYRDRLRAMPPELAEASAQELQSRIDSMQMVYARNIRALEVLDSLLVGSDMWSRKLDHLASQAANVRGVWVDSWEPLNSTLTLNGNATTRDRVVQFAERLDGEILMLNFAEIRDWPVYSFKMRVPLRADLPQVTRYLREQAAQRQMAERTSAPSPDAPIAMAGE